MENRTQKAIWRRAADISPIQAECSKDLILPDSYPDIRKILCTRETLLPERSYIDNGRLMSGGNLVCKVLFSDENDRPHTVSFTLEYSASAPVSEESSEAEVNTEEILKNISTRALNPRKLGIRGKIEIVPRIYCETDADPQISAEIEAASIEKRVKAVDFWKITRISERSIEASEDLSLPGDAALQEIVFSDLIMNTPSCEALQGSIRFSGEAVLELLYRTTDGALRFIELPIPFHSGIDADVTPEALCTVKLTPEALSVLPAEDATGEAHGIELDFSYTVSAWIAQPASCAQVIDCYSVACATQTEEGNMQVVDQLRKREKQQRRMLSASAEGMKKCIKSFARVWVDSREKSEGGLILHCIAEVTLLGTDENDALKTIVLTDAFPWEIEESEEANVSFTASADPVIEAEEAKLSLNVTAEILAWQNTEIGCVRMLRKADDQGSSRRGSVTLCYPTAGETIWEIAKRYRLPQSVLLAANTVTEGALPQVLLIPGERKAIFSKMI